jgi:periplasmic divalent cation tolerance protein
LTDAVQVMTAVDSREAADRIARELLEARLAACVQVLGPVQSRYWWNGRIEEAEEWLCLAKTRLGLYPDVERAIIAAHPYETPEVLAIPVLDGSAAYLDWLTAETAGPDRAG